MAAPSPTLAHPPLFVENCVISRFMFFSFCTIHLLGCTVNCSFIDTLHSKPFLAADCFFTEAPSLSVLKRPLTYNSTKYGVALQPTVSMRKRYCNMHNGRQFVTRPPAQVADDAEVLRKLRTLEHHPLLDISIYANKICSCFHY